MEPISPASTVFLTALKYRNELVILHLVSAYCKPHLLYATDCVGISVTQLRDIGHTRQCTILDIFHINGAAVQHVRNVTSKVPINIVIRNRQIKFLTGLSRVGNVVLRFLLNVMDRNVLAELPNRRDS